MAVFGLQTRKEIQYQGALSPFGNTYHFETLAGQVFNDSAVADQVIALERNVTSSRVRFTGWTTFGPTDGTALENVIREDGIVNLSGFGSLQNGVYNECCSLIVWPMPRSPILNRKRWMRKFLRLGFGGAQLTAAEAQGEAPLNGALKTVLTDYATGLLNIQSGGAQLALTTREGTNSNDPPVVRDYVFTRDIGA